MDTKTPSDAINTMYEIAHKLDANQLAFDGDQALYSQVLQLSKVSKQTKQLSSQFLSKYFKRFPTLQGQALESLIDLIEEDDIPIRINAIKAFPSICRDNPDYIAKLVDILGQLLNTDSPIEYETVKNSLMELYKLDSATTLNSVLLFLESYSSQKDFMLKFLKERMLPLIKVDFGKKTVEEKTFFRERMLKLITATTDKDCDILFELFESFPGTQLKDVVVYLDTILPVFQTQKIADIKKRLYYLIRLMIRKSSKVNEPTNCKIYEYYSKTIFPSFGELDEADKIEFLTLFAQISRICNATDAPALFEIVFNKIMEFIPKPVPADYDFKLNILEALLYSFSYLGAKTPALLRKHCAYITNTGQPSDMAVELVPANFDNFVSRLRSVNEKVGALESKLKKAREVLPKTDPQLATIEKTYITTQNLLTLVRNLSKNPPVLQPSMNLSFSVVKIDKPNKPHKQQQQHVQQQHVQQPRQPPQQKAQVQVAADQQNKGGKAQSDDTKKNRYSPYVPPSMRSGGGARKRQLDEEADDGVVLQLSSNKTKKLSKFKGRGNKNF
ncbi:hypothetical protein SAMD00019534_095800 [Acytostelium subglobosum LB1]|uniref:hypothetical protein n=1 Tax=Acytostelium subglobosum LB1 TaxID=1410327 RepID=UPI000644DC0A|nr:hypothetical protein SAMD00019534_095800 [Acytostelium subglobosum LB1]GAM26405.1 hypothetical protein SAMD00019534_095800 [Acytostelium subglobosum LB1]|eukprot:XP_012750501.1 hypothetical protein SAMD00019534_095800 [Acytostelium subglobosum LB1]